jgi:hypothetical protein
MEKFLIGLAGIFFLARIILKIISSSKNNTFKKHFDKPNSKPVWTQQNVQTSPNIADVPATVNDENAIIDITPANTNTNTNKSTETNGQPLEIPPWEYHYIYSYSEILQATDERRRFYFYFRDRFLDGEYLDLKGNINYASILMYELLDRYDTDKNISELEKQLGLIGQHYPKIKSYANTYLIRKMKESGDSEGAERIQDEEYNFWKLGGKYKDKFNLNREEVKLLNQLSYTYNKFNGIDMCMSKIVKFYCAVINELKNTYMQKNTTIDVEFTLIARLLMSYRIIQDVDTAKNTIYSHIFKYCENAIREFCECTQLNVETGYPKNIQRIYDEKILSEVTTIISRLIQNETPLEIKKIYHSFPQLRNKYLKDLKKNYTDSKLFFNEIIELNINNSESIFYSATVFLLKRDKEMTLKLYFYYLRASVKNHTILTEKRMISLLVNQKWEEAIRTLKKKYPIMLQIYELNLRIFNLLSNNKEQVSVLKNLLTVFIWTKKLDDAINGIPEIFRKKIQIDSRSIVEIQRQHTESVTLLNEYLKDESEDENNIPPVSVPQTENTNADDIGFSQIQMDVLSLFAENNLSLSHSDMETFAKSKNVMKNQLVESINELCYEPLDDILIEEDEEYYTINSSYYQKVLAK